MATDIQLPVCALSKAASFLDDLSSITKTRTVHPTIEMAIKHCKEIISGGNVPDSNRRLAALEFLGAACVLFSLDLSFKYSNAFQTISWRFDEYEPFRVRVLSGRLWDRPVNHGSAERIEQEAQYSLNKFKNNNGPLHVANWIKNLAANEIDTVNDNDNSNGNNNTVEINTVDNITNGETIHEISDPVDAHTKIAVTSARSTISTQSHSSTGYLSTKASTESLKSKRSTNSTTSFPPGFHTEDKSERPFAGPRLKKSPEPSALPMPVFHQKKEIQKSTHLSSTCSEDPIQTSSTPITAHHKDPAGALPTPPASPVYNDDSEERNQLATLEATLFTLASAYLSNSNIGTTVEKLNILYDAIENSHLTSTSNPQLTDKMIEVVRSVTDEQIKNSKAGDMLDRDALEEICSLKKRIDTLKDDIQECDPALKDLQTFVQHLKQHV